MLLLQQKWPLRQQVYGAKKLVVVLTNSSSVIAISIKDTLRPLKKILYIHHPLHFQKDLYETGVLIDSNNEINAMTSDYTAKLGLEVQKTNTGA